MCPQLITFLLVGRQHFNTTKIEYMTLVEASKEGMWLKDLINNVGFTQ